MTGSGVVIVGVVVAAVVTGSGVVIVVVDIVAAIAPWPGVVVIGVVVNAIVAGVDSPADACAPRVGRMLDLIARPTHIAGGPGLY